MASGSSFYHVFLSSVDETRDNFTCFLNDALKDDGFEVFMDKEEAIDSRFEEEIKKSMSAIIVFSENYAFSTRCLDELVLFLARNKDSSYFIIPILYDVSSAQIKYQLGKYSEAFEEHKKRHSEDKVEKWRAALAAVGMILGKHVKGPRNIVIQETVTLFRSKFATEFPLCGLPVPKYLPQRMEHAYSYNELESQRPLPFTNLSISHVQQDEHVSLAPDTRYVEPKLIRKIVEDVVPAPASAVKELSSASSAVESRRRPTCKNFNGYPIQRKEELSSASSAVESQRRSPYKNFNGYPIQRKEELSSASLAVVSQRQLPYKNFNGYPIQRKGSSSSSMEHENPLSQYLKRCPPDGEGKIVLYTNYKGKASTIEDCNAMEDILEDHSVEYETRDTRFKDELRQLVGDFNCPRLFVAGRDIGNLQDVEKLHKDKLDNILEYFKQINPSSRIHDSWKDDTAIHTHRDTSQKGLKDTRETWTRGNCTYTRNTFDDGLVTYNVEHKDRRDTGKKGLKGQTKSK